MLTPVCVNINTFFYPIGNTPAVSLAQFMPPGKATDVLLLGCGDLRNVLFTSHVDGREMDITCCDNQKGIIARNILLLSLIIDDDGNKNSDYLWDIYYHMYIDEKALSLLRSQAKKLFDISATMDDWQRSKYGSRLIFCDSATLFDVRKMWGFYCADQNESDFKQYLESAITKARSQRGGAGRGFDGSRSAIPAHYSSTKDFIELEKHYWKHGSYDMTAGTTTANHPNPTCLAGDSEGAASIHYGTNPLLGFHLATAYAPIRQGSSGSDNIENLAQRDKVVAVARKEFHDWTVSYRESLSEIKVRFFIGDAVSFAHTLQHRLVTKNDTAHWYRERYGLQPLVLDGPDCKSGVAPLSFDVIDTSNLCDHLGSLILLTATSPLLRNRASSVLLTETTLRHGENYEEVLSKMLGGHVPSISTLLGLFPVEYWTNTSSISIGDERALFEGVGESFGIKSTGSITANMFFRACWKRPLCMTSLNGTSPNAPSIRFDADQLAQLLYQVYLHMFHREAFAHKLDFGRFLGSALLWYHRASFASFLRLVQTKVACDWDAAMNTLIGLIMSRADAPMGMNYIQELYSYLHIMGIFSCDYLKHWDSLKNGEFDWAADLAPPLSHTPPSGKKWGTCETGMTYLPLDLGSPFLHCLLEGVTSGWQNIFLACQLGFGEVSTHGEPWSHSFKISVAEDDAGWSGSSPLVATFYVPTYWLLNEPRGTKTAFGIHTTPGTAFGFVPKLGISMNVYETTLSNSNAVYITRYAPNQTGFPVAPGFAQSTRRNPVNAGADISLTANVDQRTGHIDSFTGRIDVTSRDYKQALESGCQVTRSSMTPSEIVIRMGQTTPLTLSFPVFIVEASQRLRIARKSGYVEVIAPVADSSEWVEYPEYMYPVHLQDGSPENWNMPYLQLSKCPIIDISQRDKLNWLVPHLSSALSAREKDLFDQPELPRSPGEQARLDLKQSMTSLFGFFTGHQDKRYRVFILEDTAGVPRIMIMASCLRVNLADRATVLDCAVFPFGPALPLNDVNRLCQMVVRLGTGVIKTSAAELRLWRRVLPAYVERCRSWAHRADCEYLRSGSSLLTTEGSVQFLCACGKGQFAPDFDSNFSGWEAVKRHAVRAAISPAFWAPFMDGTRPTARTGVSISRAMQKMLLRACAFCGRDRQEGGGELLKCGRCKRFSYCSKACQKADWKAHKVVCKP